MEGLGWFGAIIVGAVAGWIAEKVMRAKHGIAMNILTGILGAIVFNAILTAVFGATVGGWFGQLIVGAIGACFLIGAIRVFRGRRT